MVGNVLAQMMDGGDGMGGGWWWIWAVAGVVVVALLVVLVIEVTRRNGHPVDVPAAPATPTASATVGAEDVLAGRFARGEIDADEYRDRLEVLRR